jgi:hypothetical protein
MLILYLLNFALVQLKENLLFHYSANNKADFDGLAQLNKVEYQKFMVEKRMGLHGEESLQKILINSFVPLN